MLYLPPRFSVTLAVGDLGEVPLELRETYRIYQTDCPADQQGGLWAVRFPACAKVQMDWGRIGAVVIWEQDLPYAPLPSGLVSLRVLGRLLQAALVFADQAVKGEI